MAVCAEAMESLRVSRLYSIGGVKRPDVGSVDVDAWYSSWERAASKLAAVALDIADCRSTPWNIIQWDGAFMNATEAGRWNGLSLARGVRPS